MRVLILAAALAAADPTVKTSSFAVMENGAMRVTCRAPRDPDNRWITFGLEGARSFGGSMEGAAAPVTWNLYLDHVPCGAGPAFCTVRQASGRERTVRQSIRVLGMNCEAGE